MDHTLSTVDAASLLGVTDRTVRRHCARHDIGTRVGPLIRLTERDVDRLRDRIGATKPGNPNFTPGNYFGRPRPIPKNQVSGRGRKGKRKPAKQGS